MKFYIISTSLLLLLFGCGNNQPAATQENITNNASVETNFPTFWIAFRQAVIDHNIVEIKKRTTFPLQTRGVMDDSPIVPFSENNFEIIFDLFLETPTGLNPDNFNETNRQYIEVNKTITFNTNKIPMMSDSSTANITSMEFKKTADGWKLAFLYLDIPDTVALSN